ncbi:hypothetical protein KSP39_PZI005762 [Platanthera zijinensis]|uniref:Uncharacterized protein n=1 Tax=Platanthera zijinensis TaxID=2320716 RepID=A0AAP0BTB3_9ASPA
MVVRRSCPWSLMFTPLELRRPTKEMSHGGKEMRRSYGSLWTWWRNFAIWLPSGRRRSNEGWPSTSTSM